MYEICLSIFACLLDAVQWVGVPWVGVLVDVSANVWMSVLEGGDDRQAGLPSVGFRSPW